MVKYTLESDVDDYVKKSLTSLGLKKLFDFNEKSSMSPYLKESLRGAAKTDKKSNFGIPDFSIEKYRVPVVIECKLGNNKHISSNKSGIKLDEASVAKYAVNGAVHYAQHMIASKKFSEVIAIGITGDSEEDITISVYYVFSQAIPPKFLVSYQNLNFLQNEKSFEAFYKDATITEEEKHVILIQSRDEILRQAKKLNKLMNNFNIGIEQRVVYVSGMLLSMQDVVNKSGEIVDVGLTVNDLLGINTDQKRDSVIIINHIQEYLDVKDIDLDKKRIMIEQFKNVISLDNARDEKKAIDKLVGTILFEEASITKQIFAFLYKNVYLSIDMTQGALDIMAEMYSTFLKYALSDGASLGKVLTPPYITNLMARVLDVNMKSRVMDLATGSAAFLVAAMDLMISDANSKLGKNTTIAEKAIDDIKKKQLLGIEVDAKMYTLAASNMILRGDGSSNIRKADSFNTPSELFSSFSSNVLLLNPPFSYEDFGLPFFEFGLDNMEENGLAAVIIQDSAGSGKAVNTTKRILAKHTMLASIKMPTDLFVPNAIVQTSIYVFRAKRPHNFKYDIVKFIDFRNDGYKRTERCIKDVDHPIERYQDIYLLYKLGFNASKDPSFHGELWNLKQIYCEDTISEDGNDWNFDKHIDYDTTAEPVDFFNGVKSHLSWDFSNYILGLPMMGNLKFATPYKFEKIKAKDIFNISSATPSFDKGDLTPVTDKCFDYITRTTVNRGICQYTGFIESEGIMPAHSFSLGLMSMVFFYRKNPWYAGQFIKIVTCKDSNVSEFAMVYLESLLNKLTPKLLSVLVRDVEDVFNECELILPITKAGKVDYTWMDNYVSNIRKSLINNLANSSIYS